MTFHLRHPTRAGWFPKQPELTSIYHFLTFFKLPITPHSQERPHETRPQPFGVPPPAASSGRSGAALFQRAGVASAAFFPGPQSHLPPRTDRRQRGLRALFARL